MSIRDFVMRHTTLPLRRGITSYQPDLAHGSELGSNMLWSTGMRMARTGAYFCEDCVREDLDFHGRSYWRRAHQIPGVLCCQKHSTPLKFVEDHSAVFDAPSRLIARSQVVDATWCKNVMANEAVARFLAICDGLMDHPQPYSVGNVSEVLRQKWTSYLETEGETTKASLPLFSDLLIDCFGRDWLALVLPELAQKPEKQRLTKIDSIFYTKTSTSSVFAYALACAALFQSAEDALNSLGKPRPMADRPRGRRKIDIDTDTLISAYIELGGSHAKVAQKFGLVQGTIVKRLTAKGFPNLIHARGKSTVKALSAFFNERRSLQSSAETGGISQAELEHALCIMASGPAKSILKLDESVQRKVRRKSAQLTPDRARTIEAKISGASLAESTVPEHQ